MFIEEINRLLLKVAVVMLIALLGLNTIQTAQLAIGLQSDKCQATYVPPSP